MLLKLLDKLGRKKTVLDGFIKRCGLFFEKDNYTKNVFVRVPVSWILEN